MYIAFCRSSKPVASISAALAALLLGVADCGGAGGGDRTAKRKNHAAGFWTYGPRRITGMYR